MPGRTQPEQAPLTTECPWQLPQAITKTGRECGQIDP